MAQSLAYTKWMCKYHIVFTPKYRRKVIYNKLRTDIRDITKDLCKWKGIEIIEGHMMAEHIQFFVNYLKILFKTIGSNDNICYNIKHYVMMYQFVKCST
jgi:REP element-mobilizing transposase RayT